MAALEEARFLAVHVARHVSRSEGEAPSCTGPRRSHELASTRTRSMAGRGLPDGVEPRSGMTVGGPVGGPAVDHRHRVDTNYGLFDFSPCQLFQLHATGSG